MYNKIDSMKYIITKHARQRRPHHQVISKEKLIRLLESINDKFNFADLSNDRYKISHKGKIAIVQKKKDALILITQRGFKSLDYSIENSDQFSCRIA